MVRALGGLFLLLLAGCTSVQGSLNGRLALVVSGLPGRVEGRVVVRGNGVEKVLKASVLLELPEGEYTVEAAEVTGPQGEVYASTVQGSPVKVEYQKTAEVRVEYALRQDTLPASLAVVIQGLPSGAEGRVTLQGPGGFERLITQTAVLSALPPGYYTVSAGDVVYSEKTYRATVSGSPLALTGGSLATATVSYSLYSAFLAVQISGLPSPVANVVVTGSNGYSRTLDRSAVLTVEPGVYAVSAYPVEVSGQTYTPRVEGAPVSLGPGASAAVQVVHQVSQ